MKHALSKDQKRTIWVACFAVGYALLNVHGITVSDIWRYPSRMLEIVVSFAVSTFALITLLREFWRKAGTLEVVKVSEGCETQQAHTGQHKVNDQKISIYDINLKEVCRFSLEHAGSVRLLMFILITFMFMGSIFDRHGYLVIENPYIELCAYYLHNIAIGFVLFRLIKPNGTQDLLGLFVAVMTSIFGNLYFGLQAAFLYILVLTTRWWRLPRLVGVLIYTIIITPVIVATVSCIHSEGPSPIVSPEPIRTMDGIYHLAKSYQGVRLYREVEIAPGIFLRKNLGYKQTGWPSYSNIRKVADNKYDITVGEPPPEYFK